MKTVIDAMHDETVATALKVHDELRDWCQTAFVSGTEPVPSVTITGYYVGVAIGEVHVWDTENFYDDMNEETDELTAAGCIAQYKLAVADMVPVEGLP